MQFMVNQKTEKSYFYPLAFFFMVLIAMVFVTTILAFGNPQWSKYIYMFQAYVWPKPDHSLHIEVPENYSGKWIDWNRNGNIAMELNFLYGKLEGHVKAYYDSGELQSIYHYKNNKVEGAGKEYYQSGGRKWEISFKEGQKSGITKKYYESGQLMSETNYKENGKVGIERIYLEDGALSKEIKH